MRSRISDGKIWAEEVAGHLSKGMRTNLYAPAEEFFSLIEQEKMFQEPFSGGCYYFVERKQQIDCYFFLEKDAAPTAFSAWGKPVVLEQVTLENKGFSSIMEEWKTIGFEPYLQRKRLFLSAKNAETEQREICFAKEEEAESILQMMQDAFEPYTSALPDKETLVKDLQENCVIAAREGEKLIAFLRFGREKKVSVLWQIVVHPEGRGKGIGEKLVRDWISLEWEAVSKYQLWVREDNPSALRMYEKLNFQPDGRIAPVMIKNEMKKGK